MNRSAPSRREVLAGVVGAGALGGGLLQIRTSEAAKDQANSSLQLIAPAAAGGGFDSVARLAQHALQENGLASTVQVENMPGGGGTVGLSYVAQRSGRSDLLMVMGTSILGGIQITGSATGIDDITPLAKLAEDYPAIAVRADSPIESFGQLADRLRARPREVAISGGAVGTSDHLLAALVLQRLGSDSADLNYIVYSGDGEVLTSLLSHTTDIAISGYNGFADHIEAGDIRVLAVSGAERIPGVEIPTIRESGLTLDLANWRGLAAGPGLSEAQRTNLEELVGDLVATPEWQQALEDNDWEESFLVGADLTEFLAAENERLTETVKGLGLG